MAIKQFAELSDTELLAIPGVWRKKWPPLYNEHGPVTAELPFLVFGIVPSTELNQTQIDALETAIEAISQGGISVVNVVQIFGGVAPTAAAVPADHDIYFEVGGRFTPRAQA